MSRESAKAWQRANPDKAKLYKKRWQAKVGPDWHARYGRKSMLKRLYNLTMEDYEAMVVAQDGKCAICRQPDRELVVDHSHESLKVRGLLCRHCNFIIGLYERYGPTWNAYLARGA